MRERSGREGGDEGSHGERMDVMIVAGKDHVEDDKDELGVEDLSDMAMEMDDLERQRCSVVVPGCGGQLQ